MPRSLDDRSEEHLEWLLRSRADNMETTKQLYLLTRTHAAAIAYDPSAQEVAQELASVVFSLWRSVFLSDLRGGVADHVSDIEEFLGNLLSNNTIAYPQDKNTREFTFRYYLSNAEMRLSLMSVSRPDILPGNVSNRSYADIREHWTDVQATSALAIGNFAQFLRG